MLWVDMTTETLVEMLLTEKVIGSLPGTPGRHQVWMQG